MSAITDTRPARRCRNAIFVPAAAALLSTISAPLLPGAQRAGAQLGDCVIAGVAGKVRCGGISVRENRSAVGGRLITLNTVILGATNAHPSPDPVVILAGGPGQGAASMAAALAPNFEVL